MVPEILILERANHSQLSTLNYTTEVFVMYEKIGVICWTIRPVLIRKPWGIVDIQALPPYNWCSRCGKEVYERGRDFCLECDPYG